MTKETTPAEITEQVVERLNATPDTRLRELVQSLVRHLHAFAVETSLTEEEWMEGVLFLTRVGQTCTANRQEMILLSDTLGLSMVVDAVNHPSGGGVTESTVLGPFYAPESPELPMGASIVQQEGCGDPAWVTGTVVDDRGDPINGALIDVWQNAGNGKYAVEDASQPATNLRGRFTTGSDGRYSFWSVRPTDYAIPDDGPVGKLLVATGRHAWRPAHFHVRVSAARYETVVTHFFDGRSPNLASDAVFGVKSSLVEHFEEHPPGSDGSPPGWEGPWYSMERDVVLQRCPG